MTVLTLHTPDLPLWGSRRLKMCHKVLQHGGQHQSVLGFWIWRTCCWRHPVNFCQRLIWFSEQGKAGRGWKKLWVKLGPGDRDSNRFCHWILLDSLPSQKTQHGFPWFCAHSIVGPDQRGPIGASVAWHGARESPVSSLDSQDTMAAILAGLSTISADLAISL